MSKRNAVAFESTDDATREDPGAYRFYVREAGGEHVGVSHACPCGCGAIGALWFKGKGPQGAAEWTVEGEWPRVTLTPSIGFKKGAEDGEAGRPYHWHGFLIDGVFKEC